ncbi:MAG TPA: glycosyltransferase [Solirubrobacterales bacterium]
MRETERESEARVLAPKPSSPVAPAAGPPTISVVIPVYQGADTIAEAIDSALSQHPPAHEVIVCDDGSTDALEQSLTRFAGKIGLVQQARTGVSAARNAACRQASGEFVLFLDADDVLLPGKLAALVQLGQRRPDLDILCTDIYFEREGQRAGRFGEANPFPWQEQRQVALERCFVAQPSVRRSRLLEVGGFDESLRTAEDWDCLLRLVLDGSMVGLHDEPLAVYRINAGSLTSSRADTFRDRARVLEKALANPALGPRERPVARRLLADQRARATLSETQAAVADHRADLRRRCLELALTSKAPLRSRLWALAIFASPGGLRPRLARRLNATSQLSRRLPGGT